MRSKDQCREIFKCFKENGLPATMQKFGLTKYQAWGVIWREQEREKKIAAGVDVLKAQKLRRYAIKRALLDRKIRHVAEEFGSYCVIKLYEGKRKEVGLMKTDFKREYLGDSRTKSGELEIEANHTHGDAVIAKEIKDPIQFFETIKDLSLQGQERVCFVLHVFFGLEMREIGLALGLSGARVGQIMYSAKTKLSKK